MAKVGINIKEGTVAKNTKPVIVGIDLGTTNSLVAIITDGETRVIKDVSGSSALMPSVIHFLEDGQPVTGREAIKGFETAPDRTIASVKRLMGKSFDDLETHTKNLSFKINDDDPDQLVRIEVDGKFYTPIELSSYILKALKVRAEKALNATIEKAVITVPAYFNDTQRQATRDAGKLAGLEVLRIVNEPTAASLAYGIGLDKNETQNIAVYDLGGGTFDVSILHIEDGIFEVLSTNGDTFLGGDDIDHGIVDLWQKNKGVDKLSRVQLKLLAEKAKKYLSEHDTFQEKYEGVEIVLSKKELQSIMLPLLNRTIKSCDLALKDAGLDRQNIDRVVLVGGSTRSDIVRDAVADFFGQKPSDELNPDEVVAQGAAIQADILAGNRKDLLLLDITPLSLGIETVGGLMDVIIPRNTSIPIKAGRQYTTSIDGQANLKVSIFQGERDMVDDNRKLGEFILKGIPSMPAGIPKIDITFKIDANGILEVSAKELRSEVEQKVELRSQFGLSEEEMAKMLLDSISHAQEDMALRALKEAQVEGEQLLLSMKKFKSQHADIVAPHLDQIENLESKLSELINVGDKDAIMTAIETLNEYTRPLAEKAMDVTIASAMKGRKI